MKKLTNLNHKQFMNKELYIRLLECIRENMPIIELEPDIPDSPVEVSEE